VIPGGSADREILELQAGALLLLGDLDSARPIVSRLAEIGLRHPELWALARERGFSGLEPAEIPTTNLKKGVRP
jgi:hypothetical protein